MAMLLGVVLTLGFDLLPTPPASTTTSTHGPAPAAYPAPAVDIGY